MWFNTWKRRAFVELVVALIRWDILSVVGCVKSAGSLLVSMEKPPSLAS